MSDSLFLGVMAVGELVGTSGEAVELGLNGVLFGKKTRCHCVVMVNGNDLGLLIVLDCIVGVVLRDEIEMRQEKAHTWKTYMITQMKVLCWYCFLQGGQTSCFSNEQTCLLASGLTL